MATPISTETISGLKYLKDLASIASFLDPSIPSCHFSYCNTLKTGWGLGTRHLNYLEYV